jgi:hypothetical protein
MISIEKPLILWSMLVASIDFPSQRHRREDRRIYTQSSLFVCLFLVEGVCFLMFRWLVVRCIVMVVFVVTFIMRMVLFLVMCCVISCFFFVNTLSSKFLTCGLVAI